jgi:hypothetical protein
MGDGADMAIDMMVNQEIEIAEAQQYGWNDGEYHDFDPPEPIPELDTFGDYRDQMTMIKHDALVLSQGTCSRRHIAVGRKAVATPVVTRSAITNRITANDWLIGITTQYEEKGYLSEKQWQIIDKAWIGKRYKYVKDMVTNRQELLDLLASTNKKLELLKRSTQN